MSSTNSPIDLNKELSLDEESTQKLKEVFEKFQKAEYILKHAENISQCTSNPVINELRYCGNHVFHALFDIEKRESNLNEAIDHCNRALYDAYSLVILGYLNKVHEFRKKYGTKTLERVFRDWKERVKILQQAVQYLNYHTKYNISQNDFTDISVLAEALEKIYWDMFYHETDIEQDNDSSMQNLKDVLGLLNGKVFFLILLVSLSIIASLIILFFR